MICDEMTEYFDMRMRKIFQKVLEDLGVLPGWSYCLGYDYKFKIGDVAFLPRFMVRRDFKRDSAMGEVINRYFIKPDLDPYYVVEVEGKKFEIGEELLCKSSSSTLAR